MKWTAVAVLILALMLFTPEESSDMASRSAFDDLIRKYADQYGLPFTFVKKINIIESSSWQNPRVKKGLANPRDFWGSISSDSLSWGGFQLRPETAADFDPTLFCPKVYENGKRVPFFALYLRNPGDTRYLDTVAKLNDPEYSTKIACKFIKWSEGQIVAAGVSKIDPRFFEWLAKSYNQGIGNTTKEIKKTGGGFAAAYWSKYLTASA